MIKSKKIFFARTFTIFAFIFTFGTISCTSTKSTQMVQPEYPVPPLLTELPVISYVDPGIKYEFEGMLLHNFLVMFDKSASGKYSTRLLDEGSTAQVKIRFPAGTYECLVSEKAYDTDHSAFYVYLDEIPYRMYPSTPPLGTWELTTRTPIYFTLEEERTILVTVQANSSKRIGGTGMNLDYIQFVRR